MRFCNFNFIKSNFISNRNNFQLNLNFEKILQIIRLFKSFIIKYILLFRESSIYLNFVYLKLFTMKYFLIEANCLYFVVFPQIQFVLTLLTFFILKYLFKILGKYQTKQTNKQVLRINFRSDSPRRLEASYRCSQRSHPNQ